MSTSHRSLPPGRLAAGLLLACSLACASPAGAGEGAPPPASAFARLPFVRDATLSPDGTHMAFQAAVDGRRIIAVVDLDHAGQPTVRALLPDDTEVTGIDWVNDQQLVVGIEALRFVDGDWYIQRAIGINARTGKVTQLLRDANGQDAGQVVWLPHDGSSTLLLAAQFSVYEGDDFYPGVYRVDVATGSSARYVRPYGGVFHWTADSAGWVRAGIGYDDRTQTYRLLYREDEHGTFRTLDRADYRKGQSVVAPFLLLPGGHALALRPDADGNDQVHELDLATLDDVATVYAAPAGGVTQPLLDRARTRLLGVRTSAIDEPVHWLDQRLAALQARFAGELPGYRVAITSLSADLHRMLVQVSAADTPGILCLYDATRDRLEQVAQANSEWGLQRLSRVQVVHYNARDGLEIEAMLTLPARRKMANLPLVVFPHGGPWDQDRPEYDFIAQFLASRGYLVLQPNFRGSTGYGNAFLHKGDGQMGLAMQDDLADGVAWLARQGLADPGRVCIAGASYGGYAAMWGLAHDPGVYRCGLSIAGVSSLALETWRFAHTTHGNMSRDAWKRMTPDFDAVSPINSVERIRAPLLLVHGQKDVTVDFDQSRRMYDRMKKANKAVELVPLKLADHYFLREPDRIALLEAMEAFLAKYNPPD